MPALRKPDLIVIGQVTIDDVVPAEPDRWRRQMGGSSLYAVAGARLWLEPQRIGLLARTGRDYPFDVEGLLYTAGLRHIALSRIAREHLVEWLIYEPDGSRRSLPRNPELLDIGAEGTLPHERYAEALLQLAPSATEVPSAWLPAAAVHLCPQVGTRHRDNVRALRDLVSWISVDPSPHYSRAMSVLELARYLHGSSAFLPSAQEVRPLLEELAPEALADALHRAGFSEVLIKRAEQPVLVAHEQIVEQIPTAQATLIDPTGAGDSFCGAYAACRLLGHRPAEAARRAAATAARVVSCSGVEAALALTAQALNATQP